MFNEKEFWDYVDKRTVEIRLADSQSTEESSCNYELCKTCGGNCCKMLPCGLSPDQVKSILNESTLNIDNIRKLLKTGEYSLDYWWEDPKGHKSFSNVNSEWFFIRYRSKNAHIADYEYDGEGCIHLTSTGCDLPFNKRGIDGKLLKPTGTSLDDLYCKSFVSKRDLGLLWLKYSNILSQLWNEFFVEY